MGKKKKNKKKNKKKREGKTKCMKNMAGGNKKNVLSLNFFNDRT
jgi:hypothetical protein